MSNYGIDEKEIEQIIDNAKKSVLECKEIKPMLAEMKSERLELRVLREIMKQLRYKYWKTDEGWRYSKIDS